MPTRVWPISVTDVGPACRVSVKSMVMFPVPYLHRPIFGIEPTVTIVVEYAGEVAVDLKQGENVIRSEAEDNLVAKRGVSVQPNIV